MGTEVLVLGAGFTKAFYPQAPLMVDDYGVTSLFEKYDHLPTARDIIEQETAANTGTNVNLERLMTRLAGGMPYDTSDASHELAMLLGDLKRLFIARLQAAKLSPGPDIDTLKKLAALCIESGIECISFNYDDTFDSALWGVRRLTHVPPSGLKYWHPDGGYGFFCPPSSQCVESVPVTMDRTSMRLLKLHGSTSWRTRLGYKRPFSIDAIVHHEDWIEYFSDARISPETLLGHLEPEPLMVPPILAKSDLVAEPALAYVWSLAKSVFANADVVTFVGYSFPLTDLSAQFLFRETIPPQKRLSVNVVDYRVSEVDRDSLVARYQEVLPGMCMDQFDFGGAVEWARQKVHSAISESQREDSENPVGEGTQPQG
jgi:hypothetical protein